MQACWGVDLGLTQVTSVIFYWTKNQVPGQLRFKRSRNRLLSFDCQRYKVKLWRTGIQDDQHFWPYAIYSSNGPAMPTQCAKCGGMWGAKERHFTNLGIQERWSVGNTVKEQGNLYLGMDPEDGWASELIWRAEVNDCFFTKVVLLWRLQSIQDLSLLFLVRCQGIFRPATWPPCYTSWGNQKQLWLWRSLISAFLVHRLAQWQRYRFTLMYLSARAAIAKHCRPDDLNDTFISSQLWRLEARDQSLSGFCFV